MNEILLPASDEATISRLLVDEGIGASVASVRALIAGVAAAPASEFAPKIGADAAGQPWATLLPKRPSAALATQLNALVVSSAARYQADLDEANAAERLTQLRAELARQSLDTFIVPLADEHHTEYVPLRAKRLLWLTGFSGSAGCAIVTAYKAAIFVDGRYTLQVRDQVPAALYGYHHITQEPPPQWLGANLSPGARVGYDPWLHTEADADKLASACRDANLVLVAVENNPIDRIWPEQPPSPLAPALPHESNFTGEESVQKRRRIAAMLMNSRIDSAVLTMPESTAWLLNIRGADVECTPLALAFTILHADATADLYVDLRKLGATVIAHLGPEVRVHGRDEIGPALDALGRASKRVSIDPLSTAAWISERMKQAGAEIRRGPDPCALPRAKKNAVELSGTRAAHVRDGAALTRFLAWLAETAPSGTVDELGAAAKLAAFRSASERIQSLSFNTIAGAGPNGAIVHYRSTPKTNRPLRLGELFLLDSGAQYLDGTTDVTRTIAIGTPSAEMRDRFTRVLKGHIALATCRFPTGTTGSQLDALARLALWQAGIDYDHGTGHGVGSYLGVHEGPHRISKVASQVALEPGMIVSDEPGYYKSGAYGIRIENLIVVTPFAVPGAEKDMLGFDTLTRAPIDLACVAPELLVDAEIAWLNAYHATVRADLAPLLDAKTAAWLAVATRQVANR